MLADGTSFLEAALYFTRLTPCGIYPCVFPIRFYGLVSADAYIVFLSAFQFFYRLLGFGFWNYFLQQLTAVIFPLLSTDATEGLPEAHDTFLSVAFSGERTAVSRRYFLRTVTGCFCPAKHP